MKGSRPIKCHWTRGLRRECAAAHLQECLSVVSVVLSGGGLSTGLITRPEDYYRLSCARVWSWILDNEGAWTDHGCLCHVNKFKPFRAPLPPPSSGKRVILREVTSTKHSSRERKGVGVGGLYYCKNYCYITWQCVNESGKSSKFWVENMNRKRVPVDGHVLRQKALSLDEEFQKKERRRKSAFYSMQGMVA